MSVDAQSGHKHRAAAGRSRYLPAFALFCADILLYAACIAAALAPLPLPVSLFASFWAGIMIGIFFTLGHDACHQSLTPSRGVNRWLARLSYLPAAHCASLWAVEHNQGHHAFTNLKGRDYVWAPMSPEDYRRLSLPRRWLYRLYRGPFGPMPYYLVEIWWKKLFLPIDPAVRRDWRLHFPDSAFAVIGHLALAAALIWLGTALSPQRPLWLTVVLAWAIPFAVWNWLMGIIVYVHHTHPSVRWFADAEAWKLERASLFGTLHVRLPQPLHFLCNNIMEHNAHHLQPNLPCYRLKPAQARLRATVPEIQFVKLNLFSYLELLRHCRLFDTAAARWVDYDGTPTGPVLGMPGKA